MSTERHIRLEYYAQLREAAGARGEDLRVKAATPAELYAFLQERYRFTLPVGSLRVAVNHQLATWDAALEDGDTVAFLPPVAGGSPAGKP